MSEGSERLGKAWQVTLDELALQGDRGGRHDDRRVRRYRVPDGRDEVGERLPGAGPGLDGEMLGRVDGVADRLGHRDLSWALGTADAGNRGREQDRDVRQAAAALPRGGGWFHRRAR